MAKKSKNKSSVVHWIVSIIILLIVLFIVQAYLLAPQNVIGARLVKYLPLPAAFVNSDAVLLGDYYDRIEIASKIDPNNSGSRSAILNQLTDNKIAELTAKNKKVSLNQAEIDSGYSFLQRTTGTEQLGASYGISEKEFKNQILKPNLLKTKLQIWLSSNKNANPDAYKILAEVQQKLTSGQKFETLAQNYSDDAPSAQIGGDLGFVSYNDIVPELYDQFVGITDKGIHTFNSRYGIHLVQVLGKDDSGPKGTTRYHVRQIFIKTTDYQNWFNQQKTYYTVLKLAR